ncbi:thioesterase [Catenulispora sp. NL8]|uniref:Thioesterase n=1 Tax=Catenulispora pinistramenti TaxID=2705254 RepID=A0ABS5KP57_9ACTN|nr:alpha/beta fold hydrolase [Catenulispora pinistramenti]MBS2547837.1 thioesterase [Catenulispora pinistramenti]
MTAFSGTAGPRWGLCATHNPFAAVRMYCFPHSGGMPGEYMRWSQRLPEAEVWGVQLPGRGSRLAEPPFTELPDLVGAVVDGVEFGEPFVLFGHSLGALLAYETAAELVRRELPLPEALVLSASPAPHLLTRPASAADLDDDALAAAIARDCGPSHIDPDPEVRALLFGALRADLEVVRSFPARPPLPLNLPVTVLGGSQDSDPPASLAAWNEYTAGPFEFRMFEGDHFYFREQPDEFFASLAEVLRQCVARRLQR